MKTQSHKLLGIYLADTYLGFCTPAERSAFLLGCVEPDRNPVTYFRGSLRAQTLRGHNFPNALPAIRRLAEKLERGRGERVLYYYRLGKLCHYVTDAFTWPHNPEFAGTLREHIRYETQLKVMFEQKLSVASGYPARLVTGSFYDWFMRQHEEYARRSGAMDCDCLFALTAAKTTTLWLREPAAEYLGSPALAGGNQ